MNHGLLAVLVSAVVAGAAFFVWSGQAGDPGLSELAASAETEPTSAPEPSPEAPPEPSPSAAVTPTPTPPPLGATSCDTGAADAPSGSLTVVSGAAKAGTGPVRTFTIEIEDGLAIDGECFGHEVERILFDDRSWIGSDEVAWQRVDAEPDTRIIVASPATTDRLCLPFQTVGRFSCTIEQERTVLNVDRWRDGAETFDDIADYRIYLVNHEIGHALRHNHVGCAGEGLPAPVMMQQTKGLGACTDNAWPLRDDTEG